MSRLIINSLLRTTVRRPTLVSRLSTPARSFSHHGPPEKWYSNEELIKFVKNHKQDKKEMFFTKLVGGTATFWMCYMIYNNGKHLAGVEYHWEHAPAEGEEAHH